MVLGPESRGFIFGTPIAYNLNKPFVLVRKKGKLPCETVEMEYDLEYGKDKIEMHKDAIEPGSRVLLMDDLLATGGTMAAAYELVKSLNPKKVYINFVVELSALNGREAFSADAEITSLITY